MVQWTITSKCYRPIEEGRAKHPELKLRKWIQRGSRRKGNVVSGSESE